MSEVIVQNSEEVRQIKEPLKSQDAERVLLRSDLPSTLQQLQESFCMPLMKLKYFKYPTQFLAYSAWCLLKNAPELSQEAIKRVAVIGNMTLQFYPKNYEKFSFFVYVIVHEISLALSIENEKKKQDRFLAFEQEAFNTCLQVLNLDSACENTHHLLALPSNSGMHANLLSLHLAIMRPDNTKNSLQLIGDQYFETEYLHRQFPINQHGNVISFCAGPIVSASQHRVSDYQGLDINDVIYRNIIERETGTHITLIVDATSALYATLGLNAQSKRLISTGQLSIIIFESHQKFGLLHTDQAQYGRVFAILSKVAYTETYIASRRVLAQQDFLSCLDMRIGTFINTAVPMSILEKIKEQHFRNGEIFYKIDLAKTQKTQEQASRALFLTSNYQPCMHAARQIMQHRDSFGHFENTVSKIQDSDRLAPGGSDQLDVLMPWIQVLIFMNSSVNEIQLLAESVVYDISAQNSLSEQVYKLALCGVLLHHLNLASENDMSKMPIYWHLMKQILLQCDQLQGRAIYQNVSSFLYHRKQAAIKETCRPHHLREYLN